MSLNPSEHSKLTVRFPPELMKRLKAEVARNFGVDPRYIVLKAVAEYLDRKALENCE